MRVRPSPSAPIITKGAKRNMKVKDLLEYLLIDSVKMDQEIRVGKIEGEIVGYKEGRLVVRDVMNVYKITKSKEPCIEEERMGGMAALPEEYILLECL